MKKIKKIFRRKLYYMIILMVLLGGGILFAASLTTNNITMDGQPDTRFHSSVSAYLVESQHFYGHVNNGDIYLGESNNAINVRGYFKNNITMVGEPRPRWNSSISSYVVESQHFYGHNDTQNIYIGEPGNKVVVKGSMETGLVDATNYSCRSDKRYKKEIFPLHDSLKKVLSLQGVSYFWRKDEFKNKGFNDKKDLGFVAQDMEKIIPELVYTADDGYKSVNYQKMTAVLVEAVKELNSTYSKKISSLEEENVSLKQKVASLEKMSEKIAALEKRLDRVGMLSVK